MNDVFVFGWLVDELLTTVPGNSQLTRGNCNCRSKVGNFSSQCAWHRSNKLSYKEKGGGIHSNKIAIFYPTRGQGFLCNGVTI